MESIWSKTCEINGRSSFEGHLETDAVVIGAGMAGILTAYRLQNAGIRVVVLEAACIASGQTRNTTAKITSQHGLCYHRFIETQGKEKAALYGKANEFAIQEYERIIKLKNISCDFQKMSAYVYSDDSTLLKTETHPLKFIRALAASLTIYEHSQVNDVKGHTVYTENGTVTARHIIFACHYPFLNFPGLYFARMHQERSYVLALEHAMQLDGMFIGEGVYTYSFRNYKDLLLFGGEGHRTGENPDGICHGSRFDYDGNLLSNPAQKGLRTFLL